LQHLKSRYDWLRVRVWNALNREHARFWRTPLRIAIHPHDLSLRLAEPLRRMVGTLPRRS
jgi:hypothetical protein